VNVLVMDPVINNYHDVGVWQ